MAAARNKPLRQVRERELVAATRALFDERGMQDAPIEEIARSVGIARGLIYRQLLLQGGALRAHGHRLPRRARASCSRPRSPAPSSRPRSSSGSPRPTPASASATPPFSTARWRSCTGPRAELQRDRLRVGLAAARPGDGELHRRSSPTCCAPAPRAATFAVDDPDYTANLLWTQTLGAMHLARIGVGVRRLAPGRPGPVHGRPRRDRPQLRRERPGDRRRHDRVASSHRRLGLATSASALLRTRFDARGRK